jgi:hypothetical protein
MNKAVIGIGAVALVAIGGSYYHWKTQTDQLKTLVEENISTANQMAQAVIKSDAIKYDSMEISGYPMNVTVTFKNPKLTLPFYDPRLEGGQIAWVEKHNIDGDLIINSDLYGTSYDITLDGERQSVSEIDGKAWFSRFTKSTDASTCHVELNPDKLNSALWQPLKTLKDSKDIFMAITQIECNTPAYELVSQENEELFFHKADSYKFSFNREDKGDNAKLSIMSDVDNIEFGESTDRYLETLKKMLIHNATMRDDTLFAFEELVAHGKQSFNLAAYYDGPIKDFNPMKDARLEISDLRYDTELMSGSNQIVINSEAKDGIRHVSLNISGDGLAKEGYDAHYRKTLFDTITELKQTIEKTDIQDEAVEEFGRYGLLLKNLSDEQIKQMLLEIVPTFEDLGHMKSNLSANVKFTDGAMPMQGKVFDVKLEDFSFKHDGGFSLSMTGNGGMSPESPFPSAQAKITCTPCSTLVSGITETSKTISKWQKLSGTPNPLPSSEQFEKDLTTFFAMLARGNKKDSSVTLNNVELNLLFQNMQPTLNGLQIPQIQAIANQYLMPHVNAIMVGAPEGEE